MPRFCPPLNTGNENLEIGQLKLFDCLENKAVKQTILFTKGQNSSPVLIRFLSSNQKQNDESQLSVNNHCIKTVRLFAKWYLF